MDGTREIILIVEDEEPHAELVRRALASAGSDLRLIVAPDLRTAQARLSEMVPSLVIADWRLPDGDAGALLAPPGAELPYPVIILTGQGDERVATEAMRRGASDYVVKSEATVRGLPHIVARVLRDWQHVVERRGAERMFRDLLESAPDAMVIVDAAGRITLVNAQAEALFGYTRHEMLDEPVEMLIPERYRAEHSVLCARFQTGAQVRPMAAGLALTFLRKDATEIPVEVSLSPLEVADGMLTVAAIRDVTSRRTAEEALRTSNAGLRILSTAAVASNEAADPFEAVQAVLEEVCACTAWTTGFAFVLDSERNETPTYRKLWYSDFPERYLPFREALESTAFETGIGVTGEVLKTGQPQYVCDMRPIAAQLPVGELAVELGIRSFVATPIVVGTENVGVLMFSREDVTERDEAFVSVLKDVGTQLGRAIERSRAEKSLRKSEHQLRLSNERLLSALVASKAGTWRVDLRTGADTRDASLNQLLGLPAKPSTQPVDDWFTHVHPDDADAMNLAWQQGLESGLYSVEHRLVRCDGQVLWVADRGEIIRDDEGQLHHAIGAVMDITERKKAEESLRQSEQQLRLITDNVHGLIAYIDRDQHYQFVNDRYTRMVGLRREEIIGRRVKEILGPAAYDAIREHLDLALEGQPQRFETALRLKSGETVWSDATYVPDVDERGQVLGLYLLVTDITERKRGEQERVALEHELREAQKMEALGTLAGGIAHDFNNLLTAIRGYTEHARKSLPGDSPAVRSLEMVERAAGEASEVTRSLLTFTHRAPSERAPLDLRVVVADSLRLLGRMLPASIEIIQDEPGAAPVWIHANVTQIQQVLLNLIVNARDAMPEGGQLRFSFGGLETDSPAAAADAVLVAEDTGVGMPDDVKARVFEPFFTTKTRGKGTGLGLSIVHGIIANHGGTIEVESAPQAGTRFTIRLPRIAPPQAPEDPQAALASGGRGVILIAEDNEYVRSLVVMSLESAGYKVVPATDGQEAVDLFHRHGASVRLVVLDVDLPRQTGVECLRQMRCERADVPVIVITGSIGFELEAPHNEVLLRKPFLMTELTAAVGNMLSSSVVEEDAG